MQLVKLPTSKPDLMLRVSKGHFAATHRHTNYYIDVTFQKYRLSEAAATAAEIAQAYRSTTAIDTILCLDGTEVIGACLAEELTKAGLMTINSHETIYVVTPEHTSSGQLMFRDNTAPMITGKHVLILAASILSGSSVNAAVESIRYYGGNPVGVSSIFTSLKECAGFPVVSIFNTSFFQGDFICTDKADCPFCKAGIKVDALINSHGYSSL